MVNKEKIQLHFDLRLTGAAFIDSESMKEIRNILLILQFSLK